MKPDPKKSYAALPAVVYTARSPQGEVLYVGVTRNLRTRMSNHKRSGKWWTPDVVLEVEHFDKRAPAEAREKELIEQLRPPHNLPRRKVVFVAVALSHRLAALAEERGETLTALAERALLSEEQRLRRAGVKPADGRVPSPRAAESGPA